MNLLQGARVLDLSRGTVGALSTRLLADLGAEVYRLEAVALDEVFRLPGTLRHRGKRIVSGSSSTARRFSERCDLLVVDTQEAFESVWPSPRPILRLALGANPERLLEDEPVPDFALAAISGLTYITGDPACSPQTPQHLVATRLAALYASCVGCSALVGTTSPPVIDVLVQEAVISCLESTMPICFVDGHSLRRATNMHDIAWPVAAYEASDGWVGISCGRVEDTRRLLAILGLDHLLSPGVQTFTEIDHTDELDRTLAERIRTHGAHALVDACQRHRVAAAVALRPTDILTDEQALARGFVGSWRDGTPVLGCPITETGQPRRHPGPPEVALPTLVGASEGGSGPGHVQDLLAGTRILDMTWALAGPFATMVLADLGSDVIKLESLSHVDSSRLVGPYLGYPDIERSGYFRFFNRNKRSVEFDIGDPVARAGVTALASAANAVVENLRPGSLDGKGLGYSSLSERRPALAMCSISGFGRTGPRSAWASYGGAMAECANGLAMATGGKRPIIPARALGDIFAGLYAALGVCAQLYQQTRSGRGSYIEVTQFEAGASTMEELLVLGAGAAEPHRIVGSDEAGWWAESPLGSWPVVDANTLAIQLRESGATQHFDTPEGQDTFLRPPMRLDGKRPILRRPSPHLGADTTHVMRDWLEPQP